MKKTIFFFIFLMIFSSNALGIAVSPASIEFNGDGKEGFFIFNTNDFDSGFRIESDDGLSFSRKEFTLGPKDMIRIDVAMEELENKNGIIYVKEIVDDANGVSLENGVGLKYKANEDYNGLEELTGSFAGILDGGKNRSKYAAGILIAAILIVVFYNNKTLKGVKEKMSEQWLYYKLLLFGKLR